ncbi:uncharacterized protein EI90DRAFT_3119189 [Cantharellus anzutake]|uniref:uncharacterized protein n=1 Tax=Cantharellus anzutake TaxID=1750568 RepID=UPI001903721B|nr:uncharacterized protein EI90DRAFT_3119189 [Cantharellus anzutake]KAF8336865.1 hypothetical protein EI90DRAFT_3119189 [Cantharellus anzutake]
MKRLRATGGNESKSSVWRRLTRRTSTRPELLVDTPTPLPATTNEQNFGRKAVSLNEDILYKVVEELATHSPKSLLSVALVSRAVHSFTVTVLFRSVWVGRFEAKKRERALLHRLQNDLLLCSYIRQLTIYNEPGRNVEYEGIVTILLHLLPHMTNLKDFCCYTPLGSSLAQHISCNNPAVQLCLHSMPLTNETFASCANIVSIDAETHFYRGPENFLVRLKELALSSANFRSLTLRVLWGGCVRGPITIGDITFEPGERLSSLRSLSVDGITPNDSWNLGVPWDVLEDIYFRRFPSILRSRVDTMHNLRSIGLSGGSGWVTNEERSQAAVPINEFLSRVPSALEELNLEELTGVIPVSTITRFGPSLKRLRFHNRGSFGNVETRHVFSAQQLDEIRVACPNLEELQIDINPDGEWPYNVLDAVAKFPRLNKLTLSVGLGLHAGTPVKPYPSHYSSVQLYKYVASVRRPMRPLNELAVQLGGPHQTRGGYGISSILRKPTSYRVVPCERLEDAQAGLLNVWRDQATWGRQLESFYGPVGGDTKDDRKIFALHERHELHM